MLFNKTTGKKIAEKVKIAANSWQRFKGLMFEKKERFDYALVFDFGQEKKMGASIHMLFVFFPIDAIYLDSEKKVADIAKNLQPFSLNYTPKKKARFLVELPVQAGKAVSLGDQLEWK